MTIEEMMQGGVDLVRAQIGEEERMLERCKETDLITKWSHESRLTDLREAFSRLEQMPKREFREVGDYMVEVPTEEECATAKKRLDEAFPAVARFREEWVPRVAAPEDFPTPCTLYFQSPLDRVRFLHHLDENLCHAETAEDRWTREEWRSGQAFEECEKFTVYVATDETMEDLRWGKKHPNTAEQIAALTAERDSLKAELERVKVDLQQEAKELHELIQDALHEKDAFQGRAERAEDELRQHRNTIKAILQAQNIGEEGEE